MQPFTYVDRSTGQVVFDVVRGKLPLKVAHSSGIETLAVLAAVLICREPQEYCTEGWLNDSPERTVRNVLELPVHRQAVVVGKMVSDGLLVIDGNRARVAATDRVQALLAYINMYFDRFQMLDEPTRQKLNAIAEAVRRECGGDPLQVAAVAYMLLPWAGAPLP